ncbi:hypothetical protein [Aquimarina algiphila]|uniref:hypothetical protein n=1 Tax=Aquimarina algiphila TaxID=2047982 RepID=UPI002490EEC7|nr:hypothetical protein [Aquimarina algiphila]
MKRLFLSSLAIAALLVASCSSDDDAPTTPTTPGPTLDGTIASQDDDDLIVTDLKGDVTGDITLAASEAWILTGELAVKDGATLTIEAGTTIKAAAGGTGVFIVVEQGGKIMADGTAAAPIKITSNAGNPRPGDWGGLLINGKAPISGGGTSTTEVLPLQYGGTEAADNSGVLDYVIVEYTGARINGEKEFNGITLYGVGSGTQISNVAALFGDDDAIEFFGGTVSVTNALMVNARDDMFDWTQGWTGNGSNWYGLRTADFTAISEDPRGIEGDGNLDGNSPGDAGQSNPTIDGITIINSGIIEMADMIKIRRGSGATITNAYIALNNEDASASDLVDLRDGRGCAIAGLSLTGTANPANGLDIMDIKNRTLADCGDATEATVTITSGTTPSVDTAIFAWTGFTF